MTEKEYFTRGCTALLDAVGGAIHHIGNIHKYARREDVPEKTLFIITTDGCENASHRYSYETVHRMIERQKTKYGWEFRQSTYISKSPYCFSVQILTQQRKRPASASPLSVQ